MSHEDQSGLSAERKKGTDSSIHRVEARRFADVRVVGQEMRFLSTPKRWIQSDTMIEVRP
jgi:hypothetical protein